MNAQEQQQLRLALILIENLNGNNLSLCNDLNIVRDLNDVLNSKLNLLEKKVEAIAEKAMLNSGEEFVMRTSLAEINERVCLLAKSLEKIEENQKKIENQIAEMNNLINIVF